MHRDGAVADDEDLQRHALERMPLDDAIHLLLHRAGIGVDEEGDGLEDRREERRSSSLVTSETSILACEHQVTARLDKLGWRLRTCI